MQPTVGYGNFGSWCHEVPSLAACNLFFRQLLNHNQTDILFNSINGSSTLDAAHVKDLVARAGVGVDPKCAIPRRGHDGSLGNVGLIVICSFAIVLIAFMFMRVHQRVAAVGRQEMKVFIATYWATLPLQLLTAGSLLDQGGTAIVVMTAIQEGLLASLFWALLACGIVSTQVVEDGTIASLLPLWILYVATFALTFCTSLDTGLGITNIFKLGADPVNLTNLTLFTIYFILPLVAVLLYALLNVYVCLGMLQEWKPLAWSALSGALWAASQVSTFLLSGLICHSSNARVDGSVVATALQCVAVWALFQGWKASTEERWEDDVPFLKSFDSSKNFYDDY